MKPSFLKFFFYLILIFTVGWALWGCAEDHPQIIMRSATDGKAEPPPNPNSITDRKDQAKPDSSSEAPASQNQSRTSLPSSLIQPVAKEEIDVEITTKFGEIVLALDKQAAPKTVANFIKLAQSGFYDGTTFHRIIPGFMIQGGDPNSKGSDRSQYGTGGPGYTIPAEIGLQHVRGAVATARLGDEVNPQKESSGSQFFICVADVHFLDGNYTVFGHVIKGMDVVDKIVQQSKDGRDDPLERIEMKVRVLPDGAAESKST